MKTLIRVKKKKLSIGYQQLAQKIWKVPKTDFFVNHIGTDKTLQKECWLAFWYNFYDFSTEWKKVPVPWQDTPLSFSFEQSTQDFLSVCSDHLNELTVTKMGYYDLIYYLATQLDGVIQERGSDIWITPKRFMEKHNDVMQLSLQKAIMQSVKEAQSLTAIEEKENYFNT